MKLQIGKQILEVADFAAASAAYCAARDASGLGANQFPKGYLPGHHISYNGKVWKEGTWEPGAVPVHNPYTEAIAKNAGEQLEAAYPFGYRSNDGP